MAPSPTVTFRLPPELKAQCEALAAAEGRTLSNWILRQLDRVVRESAETATGPESDGARED